MMAPQVVKQATVLRDRCFRPVLVYNDRYDPTKLLSEDLKADYSPYDYRELLFDDREVDIRRLPTGYVLAPTAKRKISS